MSHKGESQYSVTEGDGCVVIRRGERGRPLVAGVLGQDRDPDTGKRTLYLDRRIHDFDGETMGLWTATGAISTILSHTPPAAP